MSGTVPISVVIPVYNHAALLPRANPPAKLASDRLGRLRVSHGLREAGHHAPQGPRRHESCPRRGFRKSRRPASARCGDAPACCMVGNAALTDRLVIFCA